MKPIPYREVRRKLMKAGFYEVAQAGSHVKFAETIERPDNGDGSKTSRSGERNTPKYPKASTSY